MILRGAALIALAAVALATLAPAAGAYGDDQVVLEYGVSVSFLMASNMGDPDRAVGEGTGSAVVRVSGRGGSLVANMSRTVRLEIDVRELLEVFSSLNRSWSRVLGPGDLITLNETGMNAFLRNVIRQVRPGLVIERTARLSRWGDRPALVVRVRIFNNESRPEYLMLYRLSINGTYYYDLSTGYLLESSIRYWVITSQGPMQVYMNGSADYRLMNVGALPEPGKAKTYWFRIGYDTGKVIVVWEGEGVPQAVVEDGRIVVRGGGSRIVSVAILSPYEPTIEFGGGEVSPTTHPLSPPWGSFTLATVRAEELRIGFEEGVDEVSEAPPGEGIPWYVMPVAGAAAAVIGAVLVVRKRRG